MIWNWFQKKVEIFGLTSSMITGGGLIGIFNTATAIIACITALFSLLVMIEKHTDYDIPFINVKQKEKTDG